MEKEAIAAERLLGTWRLIETTAVDARGAAKPSPYGPIPMGRLIFNADGRMMAVVCDGRTTIPAGEKRRYASYCGNFEIDGDVLTTHVDAAAIEGRIGGVQVRRLEFREGRLILIPPRRPDGEQRELVWAYDGPA